jgi:hypothetical protein
VTLRAGTVLDVTTDGVVGRREAIRLAVMGLGLGAVAAGCRGQGSPTVEAGPDATIPYRLVASYPTGVPYVAAGAPSRLPFQIARPDGTLLDDLPAILPATVWRDGRQVGDRIELTGRSDGADAGYVALETTFEEPVVHEVRITLDDEELTARVAVYDAATVVTPQVGVRMPSAATPTMDQRLAVDPICTLSPQCPLHDTSLDAALGSGGPVALVVGSAEFCLDLRCGPTLSNFVEVAAGFPTVTPIHAEPYRNPKAVPELLEADPTELVELLAINWEPAIFLIGRDGTIRARADAVAGTAELRTLFETIA